eukprot:693416-Karenia_brevis.AAC.1
MDTNVTLPRNIDTVTGPSILERLRSHSPTMQTEVLAYLQSLRLRALNTYSPNSDTTALWTCGLKRPLARRSQIDYICISDGFTGVSYPLQGNKLDDLYKRFRFDHRPLVAYLRVVQE